MTSPERPDWHVLAVSVPFFGAGWTLSFLWTQFARESGGFRLVLALLSVAALVVGSLTLLGLSGRSR